MGTFRGVDIRFRAAAFSRRRASVSPWVVGPSRVEVSLDRHRCGAASATRSHFRLTPPLRRPSGSARYPRTTADRSRPKSWVPLLEFLKDRPFTDIPVCVHSRLPEVRVCHTRTRSALVVLPDSDGFLRTQFRGFVAPRSQSWGSPGFLPKVDWRRLPTFPRAFLSPSKLFPIPAGGLSPGSLPPRRCPVEPKSYAPRPRGLVPVSRPAPTVLPRLMLRASMGFPRPRLSPERPPFWGWHPFG